MEKVIADFFMKNQKRSIFSQIRCKKAFVSEASLSSFSQKCGYRGYREFIYQYEQNFQ
jgi:DNA-binding MurR/RpiR family transcriptional regulator